MLAGRWGVGVIALVAVAAGAHCSREAVPIKGPDAEAKADAEVDAEAKADAEVTADAVVDADVAKADAEVKADAGAKPDAEAKADAGLTTASNQVNLDEGSAGKTISLAKGQSVVLLLGATPSSGFDWAVIKAPAALGGLSMGFISGGDQMGAAGKRRISWTVKDALPPGDHAVELGYARSFEPGVAPFKTFKFKVRAAH